MELGGLHPITGRQWVLTDEQSNSLWPDACIVVPFGKQVADATNTVVNDVSGESEEGGWTVKSTLETLELTDLVQGIKVAGVTAVWAAGPGGDTPALHVLGNDPFSWLTPHLDAAASASTTSYPELDQWFGQGPSAVLTKARRFGHVVIDPHQQPALLLASPVPWLATRVVRAPAALLSFSYPSGSPIVVEELWLGVLRGVEEKLEDGLQIEQSWNLAGGWEIALIRIDVGGGAASVSIPYGGAILFVRYRRKGWTATSPERITLQPGHYELSLSGKTSGKAPSTDLQDAADVGWSAKQRFWVEHPPSLRPYVQSSTFGDDRLFGPKGGFDPTLAGVGFPAHRDYVPVVRFCVPYVKSMFPQLRMRVDYADPAVADVAGTVSVAGNAAGESTLPAAAKTWKTAHGGTVAPDDEVVMTVPLPAGQAALHLSHVPAAGPEFELDSWGAQISRFPSAATHLAWPATSITRIYRFDGPHEQLPCPTIAKPKWDEVVKEAGVFLERATEPSVNRRKRPQPSYERVTEYRIDTTPLRAAFAESYAGRLLKPIGVIVAPYPDEYDTPPGDWSLPGNLSAMSGPLDPSAAQRFLLFLWRIGVRLTANAMDPRLAGVGNPVAATTIEAVCDGQNRPYALWVRTPEPIDWRRIHLEMTLRHVKPDAGCPNAYAHRHALTLTVGALPSPDGSGALLVARLGGVPTRLPRGEISLKLTYDPAEPGLVTLRPRTPLPGGKETLNLTFLQPFGLTWPVKPEDDDLLIPRIPKLHKKKTIGPPEPGPYRGKVTFRDVVDRLVAEEVKRR